MNWIPIIICTIIILIALFAMWYIMTYIKLNHANIRIKEAEDIIIKELDERYELVISLKNLIKRNTKMEIDVFTELENVRNTNTPIYEFDRMLTNAINTIYQIKNDYPKLETKKNFKETITKLEESDTKFDAIKSFYNTYNTSLLNQMKKLPIKLIAKIHKINYKPFFDAKELFNELDDGIKI